MSHYSEQYETQRTIDEQKQRERLLRWIPEKLENMENYQLEIVYEVAQHVNDYHGFLNIMKRIKRGY